ncbi:MAG: hypothetical protein COB98_05720 [Flavobacteriaceae bacterium]|nr:MAG: hypothetical protein COB98_05720 [Flavobacteriaceae bacterium]
MGVLRTYQYNGTLELNNNLADRSIMTLAIRCENYLSEDIHNITKNEGMIYSFFLLVKNNWQSTING